MKNLLVSVSGGRSSGMMVDLIIKHYADKYDNVVYVFANTGQEHEKTLKFVDNIAKHHKIKIYWLESVFNAAGVGTTYKIVDYSSACRDGRLFELMCLKYGLPNADYPHCTRELKLQPIESFSREYFGGEKFQRAIGMRADEYGRVSSAYDAIYPLIDKFVIKDDVYNYWLDMPFDLGLQDYQGNCTWCWKKSDKKLFMVMRDDITSFDIPIMLGDYYASHGAFLSDKPVRKIFRGERSGRDMVKCMMENYLSNKQTKMFDCDLGVCGSSCEAYND